MADANFGVRRTALVTGASRGIGRAIALALAAQGVRIALHYHRQADAAHATHGDLAGDGHRIFHADLADPSATARLWHGVVDALGDVDILVNNAGVFFDHPPLDTGYDPWVEAWQQILAANLLGPANLSLLAAQHMATRQACDGWGRGRLVNISSRGAFRGEPDAPAYGASKAGLNALSQSMAKALAPAAIYVYCLAPGFVATDMAAALLSGPTGAGILAQHPLGRVSNPEEVAAATVFCALHAPAAMTGCIIDVNGASYLRT